MSIELQKEYFVEWRFANLFEKRENEIQNDVNR